MKPYIQKRNFTGIFALFGLLLGLVIAFFSSPGFVQRSDLNMPTADPEVKTVEGIGAMAITHEEAEPI